MYSSGNLNSNVVVKRYSQNLNIFTYINQMNWSRKNKQTSFCVLWAGRQRFIQTIQQLFSGHKFITSILYTVFAFVCSVSDCWLKHFSIQTSRWLIDPLKLPKEEGLEHHQSLWLQSVVSRRQHLGRIRCKTPVILPQEFRGGENSKI